MVRQISLPETQNIEKIEKAAIRLLEYCRTNNWAGYDPYDALSSRIYHKLPFLNFRLFRLGLTQFLKRCPINFRKLFLIPPTLNPKAVALFIMAFHKLSKLGLIEEPNLIDGMIKKLADLRSPNTNYWCWGYSFPWQTRTLLVPCGAPNLVCTSFAVHALIKDYEAQKKPQTINMALNAAEYIYRELYWTDEKNIACLAYPTPKSKAKVHNANFLGAAVLCMAYSHNNDEKYLESALKVARFSTARQRKDGSWIYGEHPTQSWVDNFHTGYNLIALKTIGEYAETSKFDNHIHSGFEYYLKNFFTHRGEPKYFHNRIYPLDVHSAAQSIITLLAFKHLFKRSADMADNVLKWSMENLWDPRGFFYYQVQRYYKNKISYMRWSQAWMLYALAVYLENKILN